MKDRSKTSKRLTALLCILIILLLGFILYMLYDPEPRMLFPFKNIKRDDISKVEVNNLTVLEAELDDSQLDEFVEYLKDIGVGEQTFDTELDGFSRGDFKITLKKGEIHSVAPNGTLFDIDGKTFKTIYGACNKLSDLEWRVSETAKNKYLDEHTTKSKKYPFKDINTEDIKEIVMRDVKNEAKLPDSQFDEFVKLLGEISVKEYNKNEYPSDDCKTDKICIKYFDGKVLTVSPNGDYFDVNGTIYYSDKTACDKLDELRLKVIKDNGK